MTYLCVPIFVTELAKARRDIALAAEAGAEMIELRIDPLGDPQILGNIFQASGLPLIATCRPEWEGGFSRLDDLKRLTLLVIAVHSGATYVDVELAAVRRTPSILDFKGTPMRPRRIISTHDFQGRPARLTNLVNELHLSSADIIKVVWTARTIRDNIEAFEILQTQPKPTIALCMGEAGLISRILAKKFNGFLTFASLDDSEATAPGQITMADMKNLYRWDAIGPATKVYGVVALPVRHSMSPAIHNAAFDATHYDGVYLPMLVDPPYESFKAFMESFVNFRGLDLSGLSITIPHKENALRYLREKGAEVEELAERIGAVNTILIGHAESGTKLQGRNTDYAAILDSITTWLGIDRTALSELRIAVLGAGGTGRTAVAALAHYGASVFVCNRTHDRAVALAAEFDGRRGKVQAVPMADLPAAGCYVWINTTSVGMHPNVDENPLGDLKPGFSAKTVVFDTVYNPMKTRLLEQAESAGAKTIGGVEMFVQQAAGQFRWWTGLEPPMEVMRHIVEKRLTTTS